MLSVLTCLLKTATSSLNESDEHTSPPATPGSLGVHVASSHFSNINANSGNSGWLQWDRNKKKNYNVINILMYIKSFEFVLWEKREVRSQFTHDKCNEKYLFFSPYNHVPQIFFSSFFHYFIYIFFALNAFSLYCPYENTFVAIFTQGKKI